MHPEVIGGFLIRKRNGRLQPNPAVPRLGHPRRLPTGETTDCQSAPRRPVPQTSQSAVSRVSQPASGMSNWRARPTDDPPIGKSAIQQVGKPAVHPHKLRIMCRLPLTPAQAGSWPPGGSATRPPPPPAMGPCLPRPGPGQGRPLQRTNWRWRRMTARRPG